MSIRHQGDALCIRNVLPHIRLIRLFDRHVVLSELLQLSFLYFVRFTLILLNNFVDIDTALACRYVPWRASVELSAKPERQLCFLVYNSLICPCRSLSMGGPLSKR